MEGITSETVYTFDAAGNRLTKTVDGVETVYTYDANDRMTSDGVQTYTYDNNGNTLSDGTKTFSYDPKNRLESFVSGADTVTYTYDNDGLRTSKTVNGTTTNFVLCKTCRYARVIEEYENGSLTAKYTYGNDLLGVNKLGLDWGFVLDGHGSVRKMTNDGAQFASYDYTAYGELTDSSGFMSSENDFRYTGEQYDPDLDQYYLRSRYYNQNVGRFSSMDSWQGSLSRPLSLNKYNYTESNPVMGIDPSGRMNLLELSAIIAVVGIMASCSESGYNSSCICAGKKLGNATLHDTIDDAARAAENFTFSNYSDSAIYEYSSELIKLRKEESGLCKDCYIFMTPAVGYKINGKRRPSKCKVTVSIGTNSVGAWHNHNDYNGLKDEDGDVCGDPAKLSNVDYNAVSSYKDIWIYLTYRAGGVRLKWKSGMLKNGGGDAW